GELKILFFAICRIGDGADGQDDFNHSLVSFVQDEIDPHVSDFGKILSSDGRLPHRPAREATSGSGGQAGAKHKIARCVTPRDGRVDYTAALQPASKHSDRKLLRDRCISIPGKGTRLAKSPTLTLEASVQCFKNTR